MKNLTTEETVECSVCRGYGGHEDIEEGHYVIGYVECPRCKGSGRIKIPEVIEGEYELSYGERKPWR